jgi:hypothetical protein
MPRAVYNLYVDESGSFAATGQPSVVSGVLEDTSIGLDWNAVRADLARAVPFMDYPFHASLLNVPGAWLAACMRAGAAGRIGKKPREEEVERRSERARKLLLSVSRRDEPVVDRFLAAVEKGEWPDSTALHLISAWLRRRDPPSSQALEALGLQIRLQLTDAFRHAFRPYRGSGLLGVAAMASRDPRDSGDPCAFTTESDRALRRDGYVRALETLLERVLCLLRPKPARVDLWVATRYVVTRSFGQVDLNRSAVEEIVRRAQEFPSLGQRARDEQEVVVTAGRGIVRFDEGAPVGLVVADFLSNCLFHRMRGTAALDFASLCEETQARVALPLVCAPADPRATGFLPAVSADGVSRGAIADAYRARPGVRRSITPRWNREQTDRWVDFAERAHEARPDG